MSADVTSLLRVIGGCGEEEAGGGETPPGTLVTRDLLGGGSKACGQQGLDIDLLVPFGFEKRLDMTSGKTYLEPRFAAESNQSRPQSNLCDLNLPPHATTTIFDETLDLKLVSSSTSTPSRSAAFQSVCTLEKVKSALERAERGSSSSSSSGKKRPASSAEASPATSAEAEVVAAPARMYAAACPGCLLYVLISSGNPKCPRCDAVVPSPAPAPAPSSSPAKRPKLDLNVAVG